MKKATPYFKCHFCKFFNGRKYYKCIISLFKYQRPLCKYSTTLSIWKWFVRIVMLTFVIWLIYFNIVYVWKHTINFLWNSSEYFREGQFTLSDLAVAIGIGEAIVGLIYLTCIFVGLHEEFVNRGGKYW